MEVWALKGGEVVGAQPGLQVWRMSSQSGKQLAVEARKNYL